MAHVQRRGPNRWRARYRGSDGKERSKTFRRRVDAEQFLNSVEVDKLRGQWIDPRLGRTLFNEWSTRWLSSVVHLKVKTRAGYEDLLRTHLRATFGRIALADITTTHVREWVAELVRRGGSPSRVRQAYFLLGAILNGAVEAGMIARSPCTNVKLPRAVPREMLYLTLDQVDRLAAAVPDRYRPLIYLLAFGGLRWGEAAALRRRRVDLDRRRIEVAESLAEVNSVLHFGLTKTNRVRWVVMPRVLSEMIELHLVYVGQDPDALVFTSPQGQPIRSGNFRRSVWVPACQAANMPKGLRIHDLRHTCATLLIAQGANVKAIQAHLGHASVQLTLDRYGHLYPDDMHRLADRFDAMYEARSEVPAASLRPELPRAAEAS